MSASDSWSKQTGGNPSNLTRTTLSRAPSLFIQDGRRSKALTEKTRDGDGRREKRKLVGRKAGTERSRKIFSAKKSTPGFRIAPLLSTNRSVYFTERVYGGRERYATVGEYRLDNEAAIPNLKTSSWCDVLRWATCDEITDD